MFKVDKVANCLRPTNLDEIVVGYEAALIPLILKSSNRKTKDLLNIQKQDLDKIKEDYKTIARF